MSSGAAEQTLREYLFTRGALRGTQLTLLPARLVQLGADSTQSFALDAVAAVGIAFERDTRRVGWGVVCGVLALAVFALSGPLEAMAGRALGEVSAQIVRDAAHASPLLQFIEATLRMLRSVFAMMPFAALLLFAWGCFLAVTGWIGTTALTLVLPSAEREFRVPGREPGLVDFAEAVSVAVSERLRR